MSKGDIETYHEGGHWKNRAQGNGRASNVFGLFVIKGVGGV